MVAAKVVSHADPPIKGGNGGVESLSVFADVESRHVKSKRIDSTSHSGEGSVGNECTLVRHKRIGHR